MPHEEFVAFATMALLFGKVNEDPHQFRKMAEHAKANALILADVLDLEGMRERRFERREREHEGDGERGR